MRARRRGVEEGGGEGGRNMFTVCNERLEVEGGRKGRKKKSGFCQGTNRERGKSGESNLGPLKNWLDNEMYGTYRFQRPEGPDCSVLEHSGDTKCSILT